MATAEATEVSDEDFREILAQTRQFVRSAVVPREQEILDTDCVPDDLRDEAKKIRARWEELKSVTEGFVKAAESGSFGPGKEEKK